ncbi:MAG: stage II sporulation protein M [Chloroflexia bacterium]
MNGFRQSLLVARRELKDSLTDWRVITPVIILTFLFPWLVLLTADAGIDFLERYSPGLVSKQLIPFATMIVGFFPTSFSLVIALESFVGERERNTLESLLSSPISDQALYLGKLLSSLALPLVGSLIAIVLFALNLPGFTGRVVALDLLGQIACLAVTLTVGMVAGAVVVSSNTTSVRAANLLASFIVIPAMVMITFQSLIVAWDVRPALWLLALAQAVADAALIRMGIRLFNRENLLARTIDRIDLRRTWHTLQNFLRQEPEAALAGRPSAPLTLGRLYLRDLPQILRRSRGAALVVVAALVLGAAAGWGLARTHPLTPQAAERWDLTPEAVHQSLLRLREALGYWNWTPLAVFLQNVRSILLTALFALVSFGVSATAPLLLVSGLAAFILGEAAGVGFPLGPLAALLWPHGLLEIPAAFIAAAVALRMGASVLAPLPERTLGETLLSGLADFLKVFFLLVLPLLLVAAFVEVYVTPRVALWILGG